MKLHDLLKNLSYELVNGSVDIEVESISYDSRKIKENSMFVCVKGANTNGHYYINEAIKRGALAVVIQEIGRASCRERV